jgi:putative ABC transport system permease protein
MMRVTFSFGSSERTFSFGSHGSDDGGMAARRAVVRWAWRLFRREWRQQLLVVGLVIVAVAATTVGSAVATNTPPPANAGFGTADFMASLAGTDPHAGAQIAYLVHLFGHVDLIENETLRVPGSTSTYQLRAQDPAGPYGRPMLSLVSGRYPSAADQVAVTPGLASDFDLRIGALWRVGGVERQVVGIVENPQSLLDEFALVEPGQVKAPTQVSVLFDAGYVNPDLHGPYGHIQVFSVNASSTSPETISLAVLTLGMILITLMAVGGFTVLAQRRRRSLGMLASIGASDDNVSLVVRANGVLVGAVGAVAGAVLGLLLWFAYRPRLEQSAHHVIGVFALPWLVVGAAVALALVATYLGASRPARAITKVSVMAALSGRPAAPRHAHRSAVPGIVFLVLAFLLLGYSGATNTGGGGAELPFGILALIPAIILLAPFVLAGLGRLARRAPVAVRIALRDLARYRARSASALAAVSVGVMIAVVIATLAQARYSDVWDYTGPNLASTQLVIHTPGLGPRDEAAAFGQSLSNVQQGKLRGQAGARPSASQLRSMAKTADAIGGVLGAQHVVALESTTAGLQDDAGTRQFAGPLYVATPQLLQAFGISASEVNPDADFLTVLPGFAGASGIEMTWCKAISASYQCTGASTLNNPVIQQIGALPAGTSAPNTVITEHAVQTYGLATTMATTGWLIETGQSLTAAQIHNAQTAAASAGLSVESKNELPTSAEIVNWATAFGIVLALCILAMSVGLLRSETAGDLRTLAATGASSYTRRALAAATAGAVGLLGAVLGTFAGYVGVAGWLWDNSLNGGVSSLADVPVANLVVIVVGMPVAAILVGWLLAGREPSALARQPIE